MAKLGAAVDYDPFKLQPTAEAKLGAPVDFDPFEQAGPPDERELNLPPLQGTPAPNAPMPLARPADVPLPIPRPADLGEETAPVASPLQTSIVPSVAALTGNAPSAPIMPGIGFGGAPVTPVTNSPDIAASIPGGLEVEKQMRSVQGGATTVTAAHLQDLKNRIANGEQFAPGSEGDVMKRMAAGERFDPLTELSLNTSLIPDYKKTEAQALASREKLGNKIENLPPTEFSKTVLEARKTGNLTDLASGVYNGILKDPLGALKDLTGTMVAGAPQAAATVFGGAVGGALFGGAIEFTNSIVDETIKRSPNPDKLSKQLAAGDTTEYDKLYAQHQKEIESEAKKSALVSGTFGGVFGLVPGAKTFLGGVAKNLGVYAPLSTAQSIIQNEITKVPDIDLDTGKPKLDANGNVILKNTEGMSASDIAVAYGIGVASGIPFEAMHLLKGKENTPAQAQATGQTPPPGAEAGKAPGETPNAPPGAGPEEAAPPKEGRQSTAEYNAAFPVNNDSALMAGFENDIRSGRMSREDALDRIAKMTPEEAAQKAELFRQVGGKDVEGYKIATADDAYLENKRKEFGTHPEVTTEAPGPQPSPDESVEAREAGAAPPPPGATVDEPTASILKGAGYDMEDIMAMSPTERAAEVASAKKAKVKPADLTDQERETLSGKPAQAETAAPPPPEAPAAAPEAPSTKGTELVAQGVEPLEAMKEAAAANPAPKPAPAPEPAPKPNPIEAKTYGDIIGPNRYEPNNGFTLFPGTNQEAHFRFDTYKDHNSIGMSRNQLLGEPAKFTSDKDTDRRGGNIRPNEMLEKLKDPVLADLFTKFVNKEITKEQFLEQLSKTPIKAEANPIPPEAMKEAAEPVVAQEVPAPTPEAVAEPKPIVQPRETVVEEPKLQDVNGHRYGSISPKMLTAIISNNPNAINRIRERTSDETGTAPIKVRVDPDKIPSGGNLADAISKIPSAIKEVIVGKDAYKGMKQKEVDDFHKALDKIEKAGGKVITVGEPPTFEKKKRSRPKRELGQFIASIGGINGINPETGKPIGEFNNIRYRRLPGLIRSDGSGKSLEEAFQEAYDEGFYPEFRGAIESTKEYGDTNQRGMLNKFIKDLEKTGKYRGDDELNIQKKVPTEERLSDEQEYYLSQYEGDIRDLLKDMDHTASDELVRDAAIIMLRGEKDPLQALELAHMGRVAELLPDDGDSIRDLTGEDFWNTVQQHLIDKEEEAPRETEQRPTPEAGPAPREEGQPVEQPTAKKEPEGRGKPVEEVRPAQPEKTPVSTGKEIPGTGLSIEQKKVNLSPIQHAKKMKDLMARYFEPGRIIEGYGGKDKVISYSPHDQNGKWSVTVQKVTPEGLERFRNHSTMPDIREMRNVLGKGIDKDFVVTGDLVKNKALLDKLGFERIRTVDGVPQRVFIGPDPTEAIKAGLQPTVEAGVEGKPQMVIPGAEKISGGELAQRKADQPLRPKYEQKEPGGLFGDESKQKDMMDLLKEQPKAPAAPEPPAPIQMPTSYKSWMAGPDQFSKSPNMPEEYFNVLKGWAKMLGLKGKIHLLLDKDVKDFDLFPYNQQTIFKNIKTANGLRTWFPSTKSSIITLKLHPKKSFNLEVLAHELGHTFEKEVFDRASPEEKEAIIKDYKQFLEEQKTSNIEQYVKALRAHVSGKLSAANFRSKGLANLTASERLRPYWRSFSEYFADQTARYMMSEERPQSVVGKFFGRIADGLKRLYQSLAGMQGKARKSMKDYLDRRINESETIFDAAEMPSGVEPEEPIEEGGWWTESSHNSFDQDSIDEMNRMNQANGMNNGPKAPVKKSFQEPEQGFFGKARAKYQDEFIYQKKVQEAIEKSRGSTIPDNLDVYVNASLLPNKVSHRMEEIQREEAEPLFKRMKQLGVTKDELGIYGYALAAPERNAMIAARDPKTPDGGSGMMNATATQIISKLSGKKKELDELMNMVYDIRDKDLQEAVDNGRLSQADANALIKSSPHYLPLFGFAEGTRSEDARFNYQNIGKGISITPAEWAKSTGRTSIAQNPVINMILRRQEGAYRSEKNSAAKALYLLAKQNPNPDLWVVNKPVMKKIINEHGLVEWELQGMIAPNTVVAKIGGKPYYITLRNEELAQAFKKIGINAQGQFWRTFGEVNRYFSQLQTGKNLNFAAKNVSRDFTDALFYGIMKDPMLAAHFVAQYIPTLVATVRVHAGIASQAQKDAYNKFSASGGKLNFYTGRGDAERIAENINRITGNLDPLTFNNMPKRVGSALWKTLNLIPSLMEKINAPIEEATRHAVFNAALKRGYTEQQAGYTALESTGNFTRRGSETSKINAYKWFFNATLQPNFTYAGLLKSKKGQVVFASLFAAGFANAMRNLAMSDDNEVSGQNNYLDIPNYQRSGSIIVKYGKGAKDYVPIPVGSFVNLPFYLGGQLAIGLTGSQPYMTTATDTMLGAFYSYAPWLNSPLAQILAPSIGAPIVDILTNKTFTGSPVHPPEGQYNVGVPKSGQESKETLPQITEFTKWLNSSTKGTAITPGMLDLYPDDIQHVMTGLAGGAGASTVQTYNYIGNTIMGNPIKPEDTPIISGLQPAKITNAANYYTYHEQIREKENQAREAFKQLKSSPSPEKYSALAETLLPFNATMSSNGIDWTHSYTIKAMNASDAILKNLRKDRMDVKKDFSISSLQRQNKIEEIDRQIDDTMGAAAKMMSIFQEKPPNGPLSIYGKSR